MLRNVSNERRKARALFPKDGVARYRRRLVRVGAFTYKSDCLEVEFLDTGETDRIWWRKLEQVHPLVALAAEEYSPNEAEAA